MMYLFHVHLAMIICSICSHHFNFLLTMINCSISSYHFRMDFMKLLHCWSYLHGHLAMIGFSEHFDSSRSCCSPAAAAAAAAGAQCSMSEGKTSGAPDSRSLAVPGCHSRRVREYTSTCLATIVPDFGVHDSQVLVNLGRPGHLQGHQQPTPGRYRIHAASEKMLGRPGLSLTHWVSSRTRSPSATGYRQP